MKRCTNRRIGKWIGAYEFSALSEEERKVFSDHMIECEYCHSQVYSLDPIMTAFRDHRSAARAGEVDQSVTLRKLLPFREPNRVWYSIPAFAMLLAVFILGGWLVYNAARAPGSASPGNGVEPTIASVWENLEVPKAAYTPTSPDVSLRKPSSAFESAMAAYQQNDFARAIEQLETLSEMEPDNAPEVNFYLGVSLLLVGRSQDAISPLKKALRFTNDMQSESRHYYLALAYLKRDEPQQAMVELDAVIGMGGEYGPTAKGLKQQILSQTK
jgi:hypothetical protein